MFGLLKQKRVENVSFSDPVKNRGSQEPEVDKWIVSEFVTRRLVPCVGTHPFPLDELMLMTTAMSLVRPSLIFEWGTNIGKSARIFYEVSEAFSIDCTIHSIDLPDDVFHGEHPKSERGKLVRGLKKVVLHQADGLQRSFDLLKKSDNKSRVLFFVDGDHSLQSVERELNTILTNFPDAAVLLHDTFFQSVESGYNVGPNQAIRQVLERIGKGYGKIETALGLPGMTFIYRKTV